MATQKKKFGATPPKAIATELHKENELSDIVQQDAQEFLNDPLNTAAILQDEGKQGKENGPNLQGAPTVRKTADPTWIHESFQGTLANETRCLTCEITSSKDEEFF